MLYPLWDLKYGGEVLISRKRIRRGFEFTPNAKKLAKKRNIDLIEVAHTLVNDIHFIRNGLWQKG